MVTTLGNDIPAIFLIESPLETSLTTKSITGFSHCSSGKFLYPSSKLLVKNFFAGMPLLYIILQMAQRKRWQD